MRAWAARAFARDTRLEDEEKEPLTLTFPAPLAKDIAAELRDAGFRFKSSSSIIGKAAPASTTPKPSPLAHAGTLRQVPLPAAADAGK